jgi:N utilization substance protein A
MTEAIVEKLVGASIGTVEKLGSMTPEELEAIPGIDEEIVGQIQTTVVAYYGHYDDQQAAAQTPAADAGSAAAATAVVPETPPVTAEAIENAIDKETGNEKPGEIFQNVETGVLEHDHARHEAAKTESANGAVVLDLGTVEGLSGAPSALQGLVHSEPSE